MKETGELEAIKNEAGIKSSEPLEVKCWEYQGTLHPACCLRGWQEDEMITTHHGYNARWQMATTWKGKSPAVSVVTWEPTLD